MLSYNKSDSNSSLLSRVLHIHSHVSVRYVQSVVHVGVVRPPLFSLNNIVNTVIYYAYWQTQINQNSCKRKHFWFSLFSVRMVFARLWIPLFYTIGQSLQNF